MSPRSLGFYSQTLMLVRAGFGRLGCYVGLYDMTRCVADGEAASWTIQQSAGSRYKAIFRFIEAIWIRRTVLADSDRREPATVTLDVVKLVRVASCACTVVAGGKMRLDGTARRRPDETVVTGRRRVYMWREKCIASVTYKLSHCCWVWDLLMTGTISSH